MLAEPLLDKFCIVFCVSFIVEHRVAIWEEKQHGREAAGEWQWPNKHWQAPAIRWDKRDGLRPAPAFPQRCGIGHCPLRAYLHPDSRKFFIQKPRMCQVQGLFFSALEVQDRKALCQLGFSPGSDNGFLNQKDPLVMPSTGSVPTKNKGHLYLRPAFWTMWWHFLLRHSFVTSVSRLCIARSLGNSMG